MGVPLGHRNHYDRKDPIIPVERITKAAVEDIICSGDYECKYKREIDAEFKQYEGCIDNLVMILHDGKTKVKDTRLRRWLPHDRHGSADPQGHYPLENIERIESFL